MNEFLPALALAVTLLISTGIAIMIYKTKASRWEEFPSSFATETALRSVQVGDFLRITDITDGKLLLAEGPVVGDDGVSFVIHDVELARFVTFNWYNARERITEGSLTVRRRVKL